MNKPVYEVVKVLKHKVFIVGLGNPPISDGLESVCEDLNKQFPNKRVIFFDSIDDSLEWWEIVEEDNGSVSFAQYNEKVPNIKIWDKIIKGCIIHNTHLYKL